MKNFLFYLLVATFPLGVLTRISIFPSVNIYLEDIFIFLILIVSWKNILFFLKKRNKFSVIFFLFSVVGVIGVITHVQGFLHVFSSLSYLLRLVCYMLLLVPLSLLPSQTLTKLKVEMVVAGFIFVCLGYVQYLYYPSLRNLYYLGWDEHLYRLFSTLLDPNFAGAFIVLIILLFSSIVFKNFQISSFKYRISYVIGYLFLFPSLFLTYSRSSYIMAIFSFFLFLILIKQKKLVVVLGAILFLGLFLLPQGLGGEGVKLLRTASIFARTAQYEHSIKIIEKNPVIGIGFNSLRFVSGEYGFISQKDLLTTHAGAGVPNSYLFVASTTGIMGLLLVSCFLLMALREIYTRIKGDKKDSIFASIVFSSLCGVLIGSMFENFLFFSQILLWLILLSGILRTVNREP